MSGLLVKEKSKVRGGGVHYLVTAFRRSCCTCSDFQCSRSQPLQVHIMRSFDQESYSRQNMSHSCTIRKWW